MPYSLHTIRGKVFFLETTLAKNLWKNCPPHRAGTRQKSPKNLQCQTISYNVRNCFSNKLAATTCYIERYYLKLSNFRPWALTKWHGAAADFNQTQKLSQK